MADSRQYSHSVLAASDEIKDIYCEPCHKTGHVAIAEGYCVDCPEYLCGPCFKGHQRYKALANHVLLDKNSMPFTTDSGTRVLDVCEKKCPIHPNKVIELFCKTCHKLGCTICVATDHRQCKKVKHIPDIVKDLKHDKNIQKFKKYIESTADLLSEREEKIQVKITSNNEMRTLAKQELNRKRAEVNLFFDQMEKKMDEQITAIEKRNRDSLKSASDRLDNIKTDLDQIKNDVEAKHTGQRCELFIAMTEGKQKMRTFHEKFDKMHEELRIQHYALLPSEQIQAMIRTTTEICRITTARFESENTDIKTTTENKTPSMNSLIIMHGNYFVISDFNTVKITVIDTNNKCMSSEITIKAEQIWSMTSVSDDQVAVSALLSDGRDQIQFFQVSASGVIKRTKKLFNVEQYYSDIVHCNGYIYGLCYVSIDELNMTGKIVRKIKIPVHVNEFIDNEEIALSPDGQTIYVTNRRGSSKVISMTLDGTIKAVYKDKDLHVCGPQSITVDKHGLVYVGSYNNIHQLTADLNKVQVLQDDCYHNNLTYSSTENKLYYNSDNKIKSYSLDFK